MTGSSISAALVASVAFCFSGSHCDVALAATSHDSIAYKMAPHDPLSLAAQVGQKMFFDPSLSASGKQACSSCHDPDHAYAPANDLPVQRGGKGMKDYGTRAVPSLRYKEYIPPYADLLDNPDGVSAPGPGGGYTQDGRAPTLAEQAKIPLLSANEMANKNPAAVVAKLRKSAYVDLIRQAFGDDVFANPQTAFEKAVQALQAFQLEDYSFHPYSSKFDLFAGNKIGGKLTPTERRGFAVFNNPKKGNCFSCHFSGAGLNGSTGMFTDYSYEAIGVPRNGDIPTTHKRSYYDLGVCSRPDHAGADGARFCGMFKTPTLRNVATRQVFFHNGRFKSLHDVIRFYNTRDTQPDLWYSTVKGLVKKYDDLPPQYRANIDGQMPMDGRKPGSEPPMTEQDMADLEAFLNTLTDDYSPASEHAELQKALEDYLVSQGNICVGKFDWPIDVTENEAKRHSRDAVQMPVLEKLRLVSSTPVTVQRPAEDGSVTQQAVRYELTDVGRKFYVDKDASVPAASGSVQHHKDFCGAKLTLDEVVLWNKPMDPPDQREVTLTYTYHVKAYEWMDDPEAQRAFPMIDRVIKGDGTMRLEERMRLVASGWVAVGLER